ncbi:MAG: FKBP-type peptidyl-prolyl cis-trans isomerase [Bacteroidales bacterium]|nr:FKBP-type peptidyl-prolyl cis-trans isomerase [Bacteroidales bacterium]
MKTTVKFFAMMLAGMVLLASCTKSDIQGFKKTKSGLHYKFETIDKKGDKLHMRDVIVGEMVFRMDSTVLFSNVGDPRRILQITDSIYHDGNIGEGLLMMHKGEKATFAIFADSLFKYYDPRQMPQGYVQGKNMIIYYEVKVDDIVTAAEVQQEQENFYAAMEERQRSEPDEIKKYIADNNITVSPTSDGLYIIVKKKGKGDVVGMGKQVRMDYTGRLLDGTVFDSSEKSVGDAAGLQRPSYSPLEYTVGKMSLIKGWEKGIEGLPEGSEVQLIMPSSLAYGAQGAGQLIQPYTPLMFDIKILSVK